MCFTRDSVLFHKSCVSAAQPHQRRKLQTTHHMGQTLSGEQEPHRSDGYKTVHGTAYDDTIAMAEKPSTILHTSEDSNTGTVEGAVVHDGWVGGHKLRIRFTSASVFVMLKSVMTKDKHVAPHDFIQTGFMQALEFFAFASDADK